MKRFLPPTIVAIVLLGLWQWWVTAFEIPVFLVPSPVRIAQTLVADWALLSGALMVTLKVTFLSLVCSVVLGVAVAFAFVQSRWIETAFFPYAVLLQVTPIVAIAPIIVVTLGAGILPRVVITTLISFFPLVISTATGLASVPSELLELSRSLRATRTREYWQIRLPYAVPYIFSALKVAITLSVIGAVVAEFVAAERGLGYLILFTTSTFKVPMAFAALTLLVASSLLLYGLIVWLHRRCFPWSL